MKLLLTLTRSNAADVDLSVTVDASTTVGDLASFLARSDPREPFTDVPDDLTLTVVGKERYSVDPRLPVVESAVHSGAVVELDSAQAVPVNQDLGGAVVRVVDGPDRGKEFKIRSGANVVGRSPSSEICLSDPLVSREHARIHITDIAEIVDLGSANGLVIDGSPTTRAVLRAADEVLVGDTVLRVEIRHGQRGAGSSNSDVAFVRSPRLETPFEGEEREAPEPPEAPRPTRFPIIALLAPVAMGAVLYALTKSVLSLAFVALSPIMLIGNAVESRISGRSAFKKALGQWRADVADLIAAAAASTATEIALRAAEHPSVSDCVKSITDRSSLLWTRRPGERGFAEVRLGLGTRASRSSIVLPQRSRAPRDLMKELAELTRPFESVAPVPVVAMPLQLGAIGVAGDRFTSVRTAAGILLQLVALHSPAELVLCAIGSSNTEADWEWLKWLPHVSSPHSPISARPLAATAPAGSALLDDLEALLLSRSKTRDHDAGVDLPLVVVLVENDTPVDFSRLVHLAEHGWQFGIVVVWVAPAVSLLPAACRTYLDVEPAIGIGAVGYVHTGERVAPISVELADLDAAPTIARSMAPLMDAGARIDDASDLPRSVSLLNITGLDLATSSKAVIERWTENRSIVAGKYAPEVPSRRSGTLRAVIGQTASEPLAIDLRIDGPHALVGGTTGSGKSELLQTWILAMAAAHSPQRLTFMLVDYKGGSAFHDCVDLPHTVGLVTDLTPHLVRRALTSLRAELRHREQVLNHHQAKDLATLERLGVIDAPPSLVIIVDEFAALVNEIPEFVDGMVDVAQRGRSLGLHLILATQRPAGVIKDNLRANTNLRIALRVADVDDSTDVLGSPEAAFFDQAIPGRAVSKTGPGRLVLFQAAYSGGWTDDGPSAPDVTVEELRFGPGATWELRNEPEAALLDDDEVDIRRLVHTVLGAADEAGIAPPRRPWLPELQAIYDLADQDAVPSHRHDSELVFGVSDDPEHQAQPVIGFHPDRDGNLAVFGTGGSGKSTLLRTLTIAAGIAFQNGPCHVYGIDFGGRSLAILEELPHVGSIIDGQDHERIVRLLTWLQDLVDDRATRYSKVQAGTIDEYRAITGQSNEARILLLVDGVAAFRQAYEPVDRLHYLDQFARIATDGRAVGIHTVLSSDRRTGLPPAVAAAVQNRIVLRMADVDDYGMLNVPVDVLDQTSPPGRGLVGDTEIQIAVLGGNSEIYSQSTAISAFAESMRRAGASDAPPIQALNTSLPLSELPQSSDGPAIGLLAATLTPLTIDPSGTFIVTGPPGSGRTTTLLTLVEVLHRWNSSFELIFFGHRRSALAALDVWTETALSPSEIAEAAASISERLRTSSDRRVVLVIEDVGSLANSAADTVLQDLVRLLVTEEHFVIAEGETTSVQSSFGLLGTIKMSRAGLALAPDQGDGAAVFRTDFPRTKRSDFPPGRALYVRAGRTQIVQIAVPTGITE